MGDFVLGPIKVLDNGDGIYQIPVKGAKVPQDEVQDLQGNAVKLTGAEAQAALKELGITSLVGLRLSPASLYLEMLAQAKTAAAQGDVLLTQDDLDKARLAATQAKVPFKEAQAETILKTSLETQLSLLVDRAKSLAAAGDVLALADVFAAGREVLSRLGVPFDQAKAKGYTFHQDLIDQLEPKAYANAVPLVWKKAESYSKQGIVERTLEATAKIRDYAKRGQVTLSSDQEKALGELERQAYELSIDKDLADAATFAAKGDVDNTRLYLSKAKDASVLGKKKLNAPQNVTLEKTERLALNNAPDFFLPLAEAKADLGEVDETRALLQRARDSRTEIGHKLSKSETARADVAEKRALRLSVDILLGRALSAVAEVRKNGNLSKVKQAITQARENATLAGTSFSSAQETSAKSILSQAYQSAVDWRFGQASFSADLGKVDDTIVPLNAARELAKQGGISFDETQATKLIETALTKGIELEFTAAEGFADSGDVANTYFHLDLARDDARRLGKKFDETRAGKILKKLP